MSLRKPIRFYSVDYYTFDGLAGTSMHTSEAKAKQWQREARQNDTYEQVFTVAEAFLKSTKKEDIIAWFEREGGCAR
tara:strand:- start:126 stop:356 length:231 start_codon:yes stop_codon:yes gene_type:complete